MVVDSTNHEILPGASVLDELKKIGQSGKDIKVGIIDGLIEKNHPLLRHLDIKYSLKSKGKQTTHGTAVCSLVGGESVGIAENITVYNIPVFQEDHQGNLQGCSELTLAKAINEARRYGCHIINISGASLSVNGRGSDDLRKAVNNCESDGILIIAAVGNEGVNQESLPASLDSVLAIGACDKDGYPAKFNNFGHKLRKKMLLAPGVLMPVAIADSNISRVSGSSFAAPIITGVSALIMRALSLHGKKQAAKVVRDLLFETATWLQPPASEHQLFRLYRLNISSLLRRVQPELTSAQQNRNTIMSTEDSNISPPSIDLSTQKNNLINPATEINESDVFVPSSFSPQLQSFSLALPEINDPASNNRVHAPINRVIPQADFDARNVRSQEKVFLIGTIGYDFGTEARLDYFTQVMGNKNGHPFDPCQMAEHLTTGDNVEQSNALIWTLKVDGIPIYAIKPDSQFAVLEYARLVEFLNEQETKGVERVSISGIITGETRLFNGQVIPTVSPVLRGMFNWKSRDLTKLIMDAKSIGTPEAEELINFINRIYYELRNRGYESHERAINYAATNAYQMREIFDDAFSKSLFLNSISAVVSPVSRPDSDCWDVVLEFFNPKERLTAARKLYRYTIDVSDIMPVTIGVLRSWYAY
ncbi:peptidase S8 [Photorhabdus luminescens]|nr:peptidase S8 [Photorhabdus luminescens]